LKNSCGELIEKPCVGPHLLAGVDDTIRLVSGALLRIADPPNTSIVTRKQLSDAVDAMKAAFCPLPVESLDWASSFRTLRTQAQTVADIAQTLMQEHGSS